MTVFQFGYIYNKETKFMNVYTTTQFAKKLNVSSQTLRNWDKAGILKPIKLDSGHRRYTDEHLQQYIKTEIKVNTKRLNICYVRESTKMQQNSLIDQESKIKSFCLAKGIEIDRIYSEYGSGLNYKRLNFQNILKHILNDEIENLIIYYKDRLCRFGFEIIEYFAKELKFNIIIIDSSETEKSKQQEFAEDIISIIHYFSMRLYGSRSYKKKIKPIENNLTELIKDSQSKC